MAQERFARQFFIGKRRSSAGILCVLQSWCNAFLAKNFRKAPPLLLCGVDLK
jgi:hypothetical protein